MLEHQGIVELLGDSSRRYPDRVYLIEGDRVWRYQDVWRRVECLAASMAAHADPGGRILIVSSNSSDYIIVYFAALVAGQVTVEVSPNESRESLQRIAAETSAWAVHTDDTDLAADLGLMAIDVDAWLEQAGEPLPVQPQRRATKSSDLASIVYTSGTTADAKGVMLSHGNFRAVSRAIVDYLGVSAEDRCLLALPLYHTYGKSVLLTTTQQGGSLCLSRDFARLPLFVQTLAEQRISVFAAVPFHVNMLLRRAQLDPRALVHLKKVTISGAPIDSERVAAFRSVLPHVEVFLMYGLTESCTRAFYLPPHEINRKPGSVGVPIGCVRASIRGSDGEQLPPHSAGEVCLAGPNIMMGYFNAPDLTAQTLHDGWLWTGDVGYLDSDGYLFLTDRKKDIIKCAGERISAREIEVVLEAHPDVGEAAVIGVPDPILGERIGAVLVQGERALDEAALRAWCHERLAYDRVPRTYRFVDELPRTPAGKIKKHVLKEEIPWDMTTEAAR